MKRGEAGLALVLCLLTATAAPSATLCFRSGFEDGTALELQRDGGRIVGTDRITGMSWDEDLARIPAYIGSKLGDLGRIPEDRNFSLVDGGGDRGRCLLMQVLNNNQPVSTTRADYTLEFHRNFGFKQLYVRHKLKLEPLYRDAIRATGKWFQITEYKSVVGDGFRKTLAVYLERDGDRFYPFVQFRDLEAGLKAAKTIKPLWRVDNKSVSVPFGEWFDVEMFLKLGKAGEGRFYYTINGQVVFDITDRPTMSTDPPLALSHWSIFKLYQDKAIIKWMQSNGGICQGWYDDLEIWDDLPARSG